MEEDNNNNNNYINEKNYKTDISYKYLKNIFERNK